MDDGLLLIPVDDIKTLLGVTGNAYDDAIAKAAPIVTEYFETYCRRGLAYSAEVIEELDAVRRLPLFRWPIDTVASLVIGGAPLTPVRIEKARGIVVTGLRCSSLMAVVTYSGGYPQDAVPLDLAQAYASCVGTVAGVPVSTTGGATGSSGAPLKSLSLGSGALAVQFDTAQGADTFDVSDAPALLQPYVFTLRRYLNIFA